MYLLTSVHWSDALALSVGLSLVYALVKRFLVQGSVTKLSGPERTSWFFGFNRELLIETNSSNLLEDWGKRFGRVFRIPAALGGQRTVFTDPRAISHILNANAYNYWRPEGARIQTHRLLGESVLSVEGDDHKRQRKALSPGFTPQALRQFTAIFLEASHKVKDEWNNLIADSKSDDVIINVEKWLNAISLDSIGLAGFSHNFSCVEGETPAVARIFDSFGKLKMDFVTVLITTLFQAIPAILRIPSKRNGRILELRSAMRTIARKILNERRGGDKEDDGRRSLVASLLKAENRSLTEEEVIGQMTTLILAGYVTTSTSITWCLHELSIHPGVQQKLRNELIQFPEPSFDQLSHDMSFLDAVVKETLRTHPVVPILSRTAVGDDSIPLSKPLATADRKLVNHIDVKAGTGVMIPIEAMNRSEAIWGPTAHDFNPERWISGDLPQAAQDIQGFHHLLTFADGPRHCIGKHFAVAEFKAVLAVLIRNFSFTPLHNDARDVSQARVLTFRPRNEGMEGLFLKVQRVDG